MRRRSPGSCSPTRSRSGPPATAGAGSSPAWQPTRAARACSAPASSRRLQEAPRPPDRVRLGKAEALRYEGLEPKDFGGRALTVFAAPTSAGVATIACYAPPGGGAAFRADCERVAGTLEVEGTTYPLGADKKYAAALSGVIAQLGKRRQAGRTALAKAGTRERPVQGRPRSRGRLRSRPGRPRQAQAAPHRRPRAGRHRSVLREGGGRLQAARPRPQPPRVPPRERRRQPRRARGADPPRRAQGARLYRRLTREATRGLTGGDELRVDLRGPAGDVAPVEAQDVLRRLGHEPVAQDVVAQHLLHHRRE